MPTLSLYSQIKLGYVKVNHTSPPEYRFWARVNKDGPIHPLCGKCWTWDGKKSNRCRGSMKIRGKGILAHRYSWILHYGDIPDDKVILHRCDNAGCVNYKHLFIGTQIDNIADRDEKERQARGDRIWATKLTIEEVIEIKRRYTPYCRANGCEALAKEFGVQPLAIYCILKGKTWKYV